MSRCSLIHSLGKNTRHAHYIPGLSFKLGYVITQQIVSTMEEWLRLSWVSPSDCSSPELRYSFTLQETKFYLFYYTVVVAASTFRLLGLAVTFLQIKLDNLLVAYSIVFMKAKITILG